MWNLMRNPNLSSELGYKVKKSRKITEICQKTCKNIAKFSLISKCYLPFYKNKFYISAGSLFFPYFQQLEVPKKMGFGGVPLKQHFGEKGSKKRPRFFCSCTYNKSKNKRKIKIWPLKTINSRILQCHYTGTFSICIQYNFLEYSTYIWWHFCSHLAFEKKQPMIRNNNKKYTSLTLNHYWYTRYKREV